MSVLPGAAPASSHAVLSGEVKVDTRNTDGVDGVTEVEVMTEKDESNVVFRAAVIVRVDPHRVGHTDSVVHFIAMVKAPVVFPCNEKQGESTGPANRSKISSMCFSR